MADFEEFENLRGLSHAMVAFRSTKGISEREFAKRLDVHESQVSRDERNVELASWTSL